jgi:hypothetical protein
MGRIFKEQYSKKIKGGLSMKRVILLALLCLVFGMISCQKAEQGPSPCDQARSSRDNALDLKKQVEKELQTAKDKDTTLKIPNISDSEEVKQARAKLAAVSLSVDEKNKQVDAVCKK